MIFRPWAKRRSGRAGASRRTRNRNGQGRRASRPGPVLINPALDPTLIPPDPECGGLRLLGVSPAVEAGRNRIVLVALAFFALFGLITLRLVDLASSGARDLSFITARSEPDLPRADILDRRGVLLATDVSVFAAYADPLLIWDAADTAGRLATVLPDIDVPKLTARLSGRGRFVWIARELTPRQRFDVHNLGLPGIAFMDERKRFYPHREVLAHILGYTTIDGRGIAGVEMAFDDVIRGRTQADAPVRLSVDIRVQHAVHDEMTKAMARFQARSASAVLLDARSGEVVSLVSLPDFDPNDPSAANDADRFNRAVGGVYELGSTLKGFTIASALDSHTVSLWDGFDATHPIRVGRHTINDFHPKGRYLTVPEIFKFSSNIGTAKMAIAMGLETQTTYLERFGLLQRPPFELRETAKPIVPQRWGELQRMTVSYGHGIAISPLQLAVGGAALVNGGCLPTPTILRASGDGRPCARAITEHTSRVMLRLMREAVADGTGQRADVDGYPVAGKTGTAEKARRGGYDRKALLSSFMGVFPAQDPAYVVLVVLDEPKPSEETLNFATAGWTAAPVVGHIVSRVAPILGVAPVVVSSAGSGQPDKDTRKRRAALSMPSERTATN